MKEYDDAGAVSGGGGRRLQTGHAAGDDDGGTHHDADQDVWGDEAAGATAAAG